MVYSLSLRPPDMEQSGALELCRRSPDVRTTRFLLPIATQNRRHRCRMLRYTDRVGNLNDRTVHHG